MGTKEVIDYVMNSPGNTNRAVLKGLLGNVSEGGESDGGVKTITITQTGYDVETSIATYDVLDGLSVSDDFWHPDPAYIIRIIEYEDDEEYYEDSFVVTRYGNDDEFHCEDVRISVFPNQSLDVAKKTYTFRKIENRVTAEERNAFITINK